MYLQLHLHEPKLLPIGNMAVDSCHVNGREIIYWNSLAQWPRSVPSIHLLLEILSAFGHVKPQGLA